MVILQGGGRLFAHQSSLAAALATAYPDIEWDSTKFVKRQHPERLPGGYWKDRKNLLKALTMVEQKMGFTQVCVCLC